MKSENQHFYIVGQDNRLMPLYQAFQRTRNESSEIDDTSQENISIHLSLSLQNHFDTLLARHVLNNLKDFPKRDQISLPSKKLVTPTIFGGKSIPDVMKEVTRKEKGTNDDNRPRSVDINRQNQILNGIQAIWLNYIDGKVYNARDLRQSKYWEDLNSVFKYILNPSHVLRKDTHLTESARRLDTDSAPTIECLLGITINYSNDSEYWEGAATDWLVEGVNEAIINQYQAGSFEKLGDGNFNVQDMFKIKVLRVATYALGVPRLFVILYIYQDEGSIEKISNRIEQSISSRCTFEPPEVAQWQWHTEWTLMKDFLKNKKEEWNSLIYPNPHLPSPATDRFRRISPIICGLIKYIISLKAVLHKQWFPSIEEINYDSYASDIRNSNRSRRSRRSDQHKTDFKILLYEDGFQYVCPALLSLNRKIKNLFTELNNEKPFKADGKHSFGNDDCSSVRLQLSCCTEDSLQLQFLKGFASTSSTCHKTKLNVIQLPDKDIKHSSRNYSRDFLEPSEHIFGNQDCLILLIQGGCKRWKEMFSSYIESWMFNRCQEYQNNLNNSDQNVSPPIVSISMMFELAQGMDDILKSLQDEAAKCKWMIHIDEPVNIYNTSRTALFITCLLTPAHSVCFNSVKLDANEKELSSISPNNDLDFPITLSTSSCIDSEHSLVVLQNKVIDTWIPIRKSLLQGIIGK